MASLRDELLDLCLRFRADAKSNENFGRNSNADVFRNCAGRIEGLLARHPDPDRAALEAFTREGAAPPRFAQLVQGTADRWMAGLAVDGSVWFLDDTGTQAAWVELDAVVRRRAP